MVKATNSQEETDVTVGVAPNIKKSRTETRGRLGIATGDRREKECPGQELVASVGPSSIPKEPAEPHNKCGPRRQSRT